MPEGTAEYQCFATSREAFINSNVQFLGYLYDYCQFMAPGYWDDIIEQSGGPENVAVFCVDVIKGFCSQGPMSSDRVNRIVKPAARILTQAYERGVDKFVFPCDTHDSHSREFDQFPPHCLKGSEESQLEDELSSLPFADKFVIVAKNVVSSFLGTGIEEVLSGYTNVKTAVVMGCVTDICLFNLANALKQYSILHDNPWRIIVPAEACETYDTPVSIAVEPCLPPHPGDFIQASFLYNLHVNGIETVRYLA